MGDLFKWANTREKGARVNFDNTIQDYAKRKGIEVSEAEHWLKPNLAYEA